MPCAWGAPDGGGLLDQLKCMGHSASLHPQESHGAAARTHGSKGANLLLRVQGALQDGAGTAWDASRWQAMTPEELAAEDRGPKLDTGQAMVPSQGRVPSDRPAARPSPGRGEAHISERQVRLLQEYFRKYARCSPGDPHHTTVSCKGELGLLCTNLLFKLGLARISTEQVEKRVERMRGDTGRVRLAEAEFVAWFSEAFVLTQDSSLTSQRYDGDDIWAR